MKAIRRFTVRTVLPESLDAVAALAANLRWSWHEPTRRLFARIDPTLWEQLDHDPIAVLGAVDSARLEELAADAGFIADAEALRDDLTAYLEQPRWYQSLDDAPARIAYFSPEFGIAAAIPQYSGGLGILAGDHLKSASDLGVPLLGVGLFYRAGYFRQAIDRDGWQKETYPLIDPDGLPMQVLREPDGSAVLITLALPAGRELHARVWQMHVGRVVLLLLDTDISENSDELRGVTDRLYGGGGEHRLMQELLLGIGGVRAIKAHLRVTGSPAPEVFHNQRRARRSSRLERVSFLSSPRGSRPRKACRSVARGNTLHHTHPRAAAHRPLRRIPRRALPCRPALCRHRIARMFSALGGRTTRGDAGLLHNMAVMGLPARRQRGQRCLPLLHATVSRRHVRRACGRAFVPTTSSNQRRRSETALPAPYLDRPAHGPLAKGPSAVTTPSRVDGAPEGGHRTLNLWSVRRA